MTTEKKDRLKRNKTVFLLLAFVSVFVSCTQNTLFEDNTEIPIDGWDKRTPIMYNIQIEDTINVYDINFNFRHTGLYPRANIYFFTTVYAPDGNFIKDTLQVLLADRKGKWLGKGWGNIWTVNTPYRRVVKFPKKGFYKFEILQGERTDKLEEILDFGIEIVKSNN